MRFDSSRRSFVRRAGLVAGSLAGVVASLHARPAATVTLERLSEHVPGPYGPLRPVADEATGLTLVALPEGFTYRSHGWTGDPMADGRPCPGAADGMAVIRADRDGMVLVRNHELDGSAAPSALLESAAGLAWDRGTTGVLRPSFSAGGATRLRFRDGAWIGAPEPVLGGTRSNCAGGATPWGTWLSCEEVSSDAASSHDGRRHGHVFEVPAEGVHEARPIVGLGRMRHEAAAVDPATGVVYLTEDDAGRSGLYRYLPRETPGDARGAPGSLARGGRLQAARVRGAPNAVLVDAPAVHVGATYPLDWVDVADPDADRGVAIGEDGERIENCSGPFAQAWAQGALRLNRGEGLWHHDGRMLVVDTLGSRRTGALWSLDLSAQTIECLHAGQASGGAVSPATLAGNMVDNVCASPRGGILVCEDGRGEVAAVGQRLIGVLPGGDVYAFMRNACALDAAQVAGAGKVPSRATVGDRRDAELAGACFDPSGRWLFVNLYGPGITLAITGPWERGNL